MHRRFAVLHRFAVLRRGQSDGGESCSVLESRPTRSLVAKLPQRSSLVVRKLRAAGEELRTRLRTGVCETLMPDVVAPEAYQNDRNYVRKVSGPTFDSPRTWWAVTRSTSKKHKTVKIGGWALARGWALSRDNAVIARCA